MKSEYFLFLLNDICCSLLRTFLIYRIENELNAPVLMTEPP